MVASRHAIDLGYSISLCLCSFVQGGAERAPLAGTAPPMVVSVPLHLCSRMQANMPAAVGRGVDCAVGAFVEAAAMLAAVAHFTFGRSS